MNRILNSLLILTFLLSASGSTAQGEVTSISDTGPVNMISSSDEGIVFEVEIPWQDLSLETVSLGDQDYVQVSLPGSIPSTIPGAPTLPVLTQNLAIPPGVELVIQVTPGKAYTQRLSFDLLPAATQIFNWPLPVDGIDQSIVPEASYQTIADPDIYQGHSPYPGILGEISNEGMIRQQRVAGVALYPLQYKPDTRELTVYESLHVEVTFTGNAILSQRTTAPDSEAFETLLKQTLLNYQGSQAWRLPYEQGDVFRTDAIENEALVERSNPWIPPNPSWKVKVREDAFFQLTYDELEEAGLDVDNLDPRTFQLFSMGNEQAILVEGEGDGNFDPGDIIVFYGQAINDKYTLDNIYWLTYGQAIGLRMTSRLVAPTSGSVPSSYMASKWMEENHWYINNAPGEDELERFLWNATIGPGSWTYNFTLTGPYDGSGSLSMAILGFTSIALINPDHHVVIRLNGQTVADRTWDGKSWDQFEVPVPSGTLVAGVNTLEVYLPNDMGAAYDYIYIDWVDLSYAKTFLADSDEMAFSYSSPGDWLFQVDGFSSEDLILFDVSNPDGVNALTGFEIQTGRVSTSLLFQDEISGVKDYWVGAVGNYRAVISIESDNPSDLRSEGNGADYILISPAEFSDEVSVLTAFRASQGLRTMQVDLQDIYDEFSYGITGAAPIKAFLAYAYQYWDGLAPSYVVLVGDGHYDPKDYFGFGRKSYLPPYLAAADYGSGETAADNRYVTIIGADTLPDMLLGRLAVNTPAEVAAFVDKIIAYEQSPAIGSWKRQVLVVADNSDSGGNFPATAQELLSCCLPSLYQAERVYLGITHATVSAAKTAILGGINSGRVLVNYIGHASNSQWAGYDNVPALSGNLLSISDIGGLTNTNKYPVILAMTCKDGYFINPQAQGGTYDAMAEVITKVAAKGAVASWASTGFGLTVGQSSLNKGFYDAVFRSLVNTIGQATLAGKAQLWATGSNLDLLDTFLLFGDPATLFLRGLMAVEDNYKTNEDTPLTISAGSGVVANDINPQSAVLTATLVDDVLFGELVFQADGAFFYTPEPEFYGMDSFTYRVSGGGEVSNIATVTLTINPVNDPPVAHDQEVFTYTNIPLNITLTASDDSGEILSRSTGDVFLPSLENGLIFEVLTQPASGILSGTAPNLLYTPNLDFTGDDSFTFKVNDGEYDSNTGTVTIQVLPGYQVYLPLILK